ncbi:MAG: ferric reductase-like transmembrane domain-containing protein [bacterium]
MHYMIEILNTLLSPLENIITKYREVLRWFLLTLSFFALFLIFFPHQQRDTGSQAYDVLFVILFLPIAARVIGLSLAQALMPLRKELGILMGVLAWVHSAIYMLGYSGFLFDPYFWWDNGFVTYLAMGFVALVLITPLLLTSSNLAIKLLGKKWKLLHRTVYFVAIFTVLHVILIQWARRQSIDYGTLALLS